MLQEFFNKMKKSRVKEKMQIYLKACLEIATNLGYIKINPMKALKKEKKLNNKNYAFNFEEQEKIIKAIVGSKIENEIYIYLLTGCRPNELPSNKNFDFEDNVIEINGTKNENAKKRVVDMSEEFANYIKPYIEKVLVQACKRYLENLKTFA